MKRIISILLICIFSFMNAFAFIGCGAAESGIEEVRACWVASIGNLDFPSKQGLKEDELKNEIDTIVANCQKSGLNTIFFQVRPNGDALYRSSIFPWSTYLSGRQGVAPDQSFDPLAYFVTAAHNAGLALHAWINPYRIGTGSNVWDSLSVDNPAVLHPEYTITSENGVYYDPGQPAARQLILEGIGELVRGYEIDGIHFDDYFYPYDLTGFDDSKTYAQYGNGLSLEDFRRHAVDQLVQSAYTLIKTIDDEVEFGISPFGIWANASTREGGSDTRGMSSYSAIFSDSKNWVEQGWLDYVCPQIYWSFDHEAAPYDVLVDWWDRLCTKNNMKLYVGLALYKVGTEEEGWESGAIMQRQLEYAAGKSSYAGHCFFRYGLLEENVLGARDSILAYYNSTGIDSEVPKVNASSANIEQQTVSLSNASKLTISSPSSGSSTTAGRISVSGTALPGAQVTVNGAAATVSEKGLYAAYIPLKVGQNQITVRSGGAQRSIFVTRTLNNAVETFDTDGAYPSGTVYRNAGDVINFSIEGPGGASVVLKNDHLTIPLAESAPGYYSAEWMVPASMIGDKLILRDFVYSIVLDGKEITLSTDLELNCCFDGVREQMYLQEMAYLFDESRGGSQMDHDPLEKGGEVRVVGLEGERALLDNGYWVKKSALGTERKTTDEAAGYAYEIVTVSAEEFFSYSTYGDEAGLEITLVAPRSVRFEKDAENNDLLLRTERKSYAEQLIIRSRSGRKLAGYEIVPQKNWINIHLRYHTSGLQGKTIVLDAGHGGADGGAYGPGGSAFPDESELNLALTARLKKALEEAGATVYITRAEDEEVTLEERVTKTEALAPDLFLSLHHNSVDQSADFTAATGGMVLYSSPISKLLSDTLSAQLWADVGELSAVSRRQSLHVCRQTRYPAVLVEAGYLCNPIEYETMCDADIADKIAKNIVSGLRDYFVTVCS